MIFWNGEISDHLVKVGSVVQQLRDGARDKEPTLGHVVRFRTNTHKEIILEVQWADQEDTRLIHPGNIVFLIGD